MIVSVWMVVLVGMGLSPVAAAANNTEAQRVVLVVLEGVGNEVLKGGSMPVVSRLAHEGAVTWSATSVSPGLTVPPMASLLTGLPIEKHRVTKAWERYDFSRSFLRSPTVFDYMDLAGGKDSAVFFMDERFYQLARPEIYVDAQMCGVSRPDCKPSTLVVYIRDYITKTTSEGGHGFRLFAVPDLLLVHFPLAARVGLKSGWNSERYQDSLQAVDTAIGEILQVYKEFNALDETMLIVIGLNNGERGHLGENGSVEALTGGKAAVPWIAWGANVKAGYEITQPVSILDVGATILRALGLETHTEWDSQAIDEIFHTIPAPRPIER